MNHKIDKAHCSSCGQDTNHNILFNHLRQTGYPDPEWEIQFSSNYEMLACCGCGNITMRCSTWCSEDFESPTIAYYPPAVSRKIPKWSSQLPDNEKSLLDEVYTAMHAESLRLAMMGARSLIDVALVSTVGDQGSFGKTLAEGECKGFISSKNRTVLDAAFDAGSAAAHRGHRATLEQVEQVMDIAENLLHSVYVLPLLANDLRAVTPQRQLKSRP
jgi:hypothetical protein